MSLVILKLGDAVQTPSPNHIVNSLSNLLYQISAFFIIAKRLAFIA
jgi:hypothetical protein